MKGNIVLPATLSLTFESSESIEYQSPVGGVLTEKAGESAHLKPGSLVAEIMNASDYARLTKARRRLWWLKSKARRNKKFAANARRARRRALRYLTNGRMTYVRAAQEGVARQIPIEIGSQVKEGEFLGRVDNHRRMVAEFSMVEGVRVGVTCRFEGSASDRPCKLQIESKAEAPPSIRVILENPDLRFTPGEVLKVTLEMGKSTPTPEPNTRSDLR